MSLLRRIQAVAALVAFSACSHANRAPDFARAPADPTVDVTKWTGEVHGHRGARARLPENTLPSLEYALQTGVDVLEMDLAVTRDRVLVLSHDPHVNPDICTGPDADRRPLIFGMTLAEVKRYDCGAKRNPRFHDQKPVPGTAIPTLDEVLTRFAPEKIRFNIETKIRPDRPRDTTTPREFTELLLQALRKHGVLDRTVVQSFDFRTLAEARRLEPAAILSALVEGAPADLVKAAHETGAPIVSPKHDLLNAKNVEQLHAMGVRVIPWTANDEGAWRRLIGLGVDGIITDDPEALLRYLKRGAKDAGR